MDKDKRQCPACGKVVSIVSHKCQFCGYDFFVEYTENEHTEAKLQEDKKEQLQEGIINEQEEVHDDITEEASLESTNMEAENKLKQCPYCGEEILAIAKKCRYCGEFLNKDFSNTNSKKELSFVCCPACGEQNIEGATECEHCGEKIECIKKEARKLMFCSNCGKEINANAVVCVHCGAAVTTMERKIDWLTTFLLCLFLGGLGAHRFYVGKKGSAIAQLLLSIFGFVLLFIPNLICCIWVLVDFIMLITKDFTDVNGNKIKG